MSSGIEKVIADVLLADTISTPASAYVATYPTIFNAASAVPTHYYTCLKDIWLKGTNYNWADSVVSTFGFGDTGSRTIDIVPVRVLDSVDGPEGFPSSNSTGAKFSEVYILFKIGGALKPTDASVIRDAELRIQRLLDYNYRSLQNLPEIIINKPSNIDPDADLKMYWQGFKCAVDDKQLYVVFYVSYTDLFLK